MAISSNTPKASQKINQKKQRRIPMSDKKKLWKKKNKERTKQLRGNREWKEQEIMLYSRVTIRKGKLLYDEFDDLQSIIGTEEYYDLKIKENIIYREYMEGYLDQLDDEYRMETIRQQEQEQEEQQRWDEEIQRNKQKKLTQRLEPENERCSGRCTTCNLSCSNSSNSRTTSQIQTIGR